MKIFYIIFIIFLFSFLNCTNPTIKQLQNDVDMLEKQISETQAKKTQPFIFPIEPAKQKGLYESEVKINVVDKNDSWEVTELRRLFGVPDINMFVTNFVLLAQLSSHDLDDININKQELNDAVEAILTFKDKNFKEGIPIYKFWPTKLVNGSWEAYPPNLSIPLKFFDSMSNYVAALLKIIGMEHLYEKIEGAVKQLDTVAQAFHIPPDADDSFCNLALGALLHEHQKDFPEAWTMWQKVNKDYKTLFGIVRKYAYRPFQNFPTLKNLPPGVEDSDFLDPRVYYLIHPFLQKIINESVSQRKKPSLLLPPTWLMNLKEDITQYPMVAMPFHANNIDLSVVCNFLFGLTKHILVFPMEQTKEYFDSEIQQMYLDSAKLIEYMIKSKAVLERPDISLVYYPSLYDFFWFIGRIYQALDEYESTHQKLPYEVFTETKNIFHNLLRNEVVDYLLKEVTIDYTLEHAYFDDFLGDNGKKKLGEDRIFSTGLVINALLDIFTDKRNSQTCRREWSNDVPEQVKTLIQFMINYIHDDIFKSGALLTNAFFSGSVKGLTVLPFFYPQNYDYFVNGTQLPNTDDEKLIDNNAVISVKGIISDPNFKSMLKKKWFGMNVPTEFNNYDAPFPFWSSKPMTLSTALLAFAKFIAVQTCQK